MCSELPQIQLFEEPSLQARKLPTHASNYVALRGADVENAAVSGQASEVAGRWGGISVFKSSDLLVLSI